MVLAGGTVYVPACPKVVDIAEMTVGGGLSAVLIPVTLVDVVAVTSSVGNNVMGTGVSPGCRRT